MNVRKLNEEEMKKHGKKGIGFEVDMGCDDEEDERKVIKSIPVRKEWRDALNKLKEVQEDGLDLNQQLKETLFKAKSLKGLFFGQIENDLGIYDENLRYNQETDEIEFLEE
jgi:hypothetical protein